MLFFPERIALAGVLVYLVLFAVAPLDVVFLPAWDSLAYIGLSYSAFLLGCAFWRRARIGGISRIAKEVKLSSGAFWTYSALGAIGISIRVYDRYINRGASAVESALEVREVLADASAGPLASLGAVLYPFCYIPLMLIWGGFVYRSNSKFAKWVAVVLFVLPALDSLLLLSRSQLIVACSMMYFAATCALYEGRSFPRQMGLPVIAGVLGLVGVSVFAFLTRLDQMNMDLAFSILNSVYGYTIKPNELALHLMSQGDTLGQVVASVMPIFQYYLHGLFEFGLLWDRPDGQEFGYGVGHFAPYLKALSVFGLTESLSTESLYYRSGIFTTFFGTLWMDFGWFGPLVMLFFGLICKYVAEKARGGYLQALPIYVYFCVVIFFMPVVSFLISAQGMYVVNTFVLFWVLTGNRVRRTAVKR
ncbi:hypothetical protein [Zoogloea sp.]|uniref:hypothetical protein n=1 Tax=Zoogloea sp. TaxID=49181 RepID=UPI00262C2DE8|nr:hypothetical protein [Zoogloea sp.]MDD3352754.1 hypothetical protein [Zoogloea sp.]